MEGLRSFIAFSHSREIEAPPPIVASPVKNGVGFVGDQVQTLPQGNACLPQSPEENVLLENGAW